MTETKKRPGRPTTYKPEYVEQAKELCEAGATNDDMAVHFGVSTATINVWLNRHPDFRNAVVRLKAVCDDRVERSLYERAMGYNVEAEELFCHQGKILRAKVIKHIPADTTAMIFWLKNRRRADWRDRSDVNLQVDTPLAEALDALKRNRHASRAPASVDEAATTAAH